MTDKELSRIGYLLSAIAASPKSWKVILNIITEPRFNKFLLPPSDAFMEGFNYIHSHLSQSSIITRYTLLMMAREMEKNDNKSIRSWGWSLANAIDNLRKEFKTWETVCGFCKGYHDQSPDENCWNCKGKNDKH